MKKYEFKFNKIIKFLSNSLRSSFVKRGFNIYQVKSDHKKKIDKFLKSIKIINSGHNLIRIGSSNDGGYLIPDILNEFDYCFSPGVGKISSFEDHLKKLGIKSYLLDKTVDYDGQHDFTKKNLGLFDNDKQITLSTWVNSKVGPSNNRLILQMDIEGSEVAAIYNCSIQLLNRFQCLVIEFHNFFDILSQLGLKTYNDIFQKLLINHSIIHIHANTTSSVIKINGIDIPNIMEFTFINNNHIKYKKKIFHTIPHPLDRKNLQADTNKIVCPKIFYD